MTDLSPTKLGELKRLEIRYHSAMPNWVKIIGLKIKAIHECEGGGFCIDKAQGEAIVAAESEVSRLTAELAEVRLERDETATNLHDEREEHRERADTLAAENEKLRTVVTAAKKLRAALSSGSNIAVERGFDAALAVLDQEGGGT